MVSVSLQAPGKAEDIESHGPRLAAQFKGDPLLSSEEQVRLHSLVKDQKDRQALGKTGGGGGRGKGGLDVCGGRVAPAGGRGKATSTEKFVSGSSQLIASCVSSGPVINVARGAMYRMPARSHKNLLLPPSVVSSIAPLAPKARELIHFNNIVTVSEMELLEKLEGGGVVTEENGLAVMYEADSDIEFKLTGTLRAHLSAWRHIGAGAFATSVIENGYIPKLGPMPTFYSEANNKSYRECGFC